MAKIFSNSLIENLDSISKISDNSSDIIVNEITVCGIRCALITCDGMVSGYSLSDTVGDPLAKISGDFADGNTLRDYISDKLFLSVDRPKIQDFEKFFVYLYSGFAVLLIDGCGEALGFGVQGYQTRSVSPASGEGNIMGARDGFVENIRVNMSLIRRRLKSPSLKFETLTFGTKSKTEVALCYMHGKVPKGIVGKIKKSLDRAELETVLSSGYLMPFAEGDHYSMFDTVSTTERPDVLCAKLLEGRVGVIIDGSPFVLVIPRLFTELFQTMDDYNFRPYYAAFIRWLKYLGALIAVFLPAVYVAAAIYHPELFNNKLLALLAEAEQKSPFPLVAEALGTLIMYEIIREAGLRLPEAVGGAVSLVGGLIIGEAAVSSGLVSLPVLTVSALSVISGLIIPGLNQTTTVLRLLLILSGGIWGLYGISVFSMFILMNLCAAETYDYPLTSPLSPFHLKSMRDTVTRVRFPVMQRGNFKIGKLK